MAKQIRIGINGCGRIGRSLLRLIDRYPDLRVVAVNDLSNIETVTHLIKWDSVHGPYKKTLSIEGDTFSLGNQKITYLSEKDPTQLPWKDLGVQIVLECTGKFRERKAAQQHIQAGASKVILSAPGKDIDATFCFGINHKNYLPTQHHLISNASCTTNCLAPLIQVLDQNFKIEHGTMTTIHSYTCDQQLLDSSHKDLRRARAAALSQIPTTTGAAKAVGLVLPHLQGKLHGISIRVPTPNVSLVDLVTQVKNSVTEAQVHQAFQKAESTFLKGILRTSKEPLVSTDFIGETHSSIVDLNYTSVIGDHLIKTLAWYDNEMGFSTRMLDLTQYVGERSL